METQKSLVVFLIICLSSHLVHNADGACKPRSFRYLLPASGSPSPIGPKLAAGNKSLVASLVAPAQPPTLASKPSAVDTDFSIIAQLPIPNSEVKKVCDATDNPMLCISTVTPFLQGKYDPASILTSEVKAIQNHTKVVMEMARKITADPSTSEDIVEALDYCKENYESVTVNLDDAIKAILNQDGGTLNSMLSAVATDVSTCQDTFAEVTTSTSPLAAMDDITKNMAYNCLAIVEMLKW